MIRAWRLTRRVHATPPIEAYNGAGAERRGGRWNRLGTRAAYASSTRSLAALEYLANVDPEDLPDDLVFAGATFGERDVESRDPPAGWDAVGSIAAVEYGESWLRSRRSLALSVPSAIVQAERNYVINPEHERARTLAVDELETFAFDARLLPKR
jgi:RES domain-containing protein